MKISKKLLICAIYLIYLTIINNIIYSANKPYINPDFPSSSEYSEDHEISQLISEFNNYSDEYDYPTEDSVTVETHSNQHNQNQLDSSQLKTPPPIRLSQKIVMIGISPFHSPKGMLYQFNNLISSLKSDMGVKKIRLVTANDYKSVLNAVLNGTIDFAWVGVGTYLLGNQNNLLIPVVQTIRNKSNNYYGVFISLKESKILGLEDIKGKRIGFVDVESTSGFLYPYYYLLEIKVDPFKDCKEVKFLRRHDLVIQALLERKIDVGVCLEETLRNYLITNPNANARIVVLGKTPPIPSDIIICRSDCHPTLLEKFKSAIVKYKSDVKSISSYISSLEFREISKAELTQAEKIVSKVIKAIPKEILQTNKKQELK